MFLGRNIIGGAYVPLLIGGAYVPLIIGGAYGPLIIGGAYVPLAPPKLRLCLGLVAGSGKHE